MTETINMVSLNMVGFVNYILSNVASCMFFLNCL